MTRHSYQERDYAFGQVMLKLRTSIGLTQASLADLLGVSRRAVGEWEAGSNYPKAERLQHFVALCVQQHVFAPGREEEEIRALWKTAHQRDLLDETWLSALLSTPTTQEFTSTSEVHATPDQIPAMQSAAFPRMDWVGALDVSRFTGREGELAELSQRIVHEPTRLVAILGMGGIGKSALVSLLGQHLAPQFDAVLWRSVRDAPPCEDLVADCLTFFSETPPTEFPRSLEQRINQLIERLQERRCLLVLDNLEALLEEGDHEGNYLPGYQGYGRLIERLGESTHRSCAVLTSREKPREISPLEGSHSLVHSLHLVGVDEQVAQALLLDKGLVGGEDSWRQLTASYAGNPLALKIVAQTIVDLFGGDIAQFLQSGELVFNGVWVVLNQQVKRLTPLERMLLTWLAIVREWTSLDSLLSLPVPRPTRGRVLEALEALWRRSLIERGAGGSFTLQSVVMEFVTNTLLDQLSEDIVTKAMDRLCRYAVEQAQAKDYVREIQVRLLVRPLVERLRAELGSDSRIEDQLLALLIHFRTEDGDIQGYGPANVISLLKELRGSLHGLDLSHLALRGVSLQRMQMQDANLSGALMRECVFTEPFDAIWAVAISPSGHYWAAGSKRGEMRVWRVEQEAGQSLHLVWQAHTEFVWTLAFSPDERQLASGTPDGSLKLWDVENGTLIWSSWHTKGNNRLAFSPGSGPSSAPGSGPSSAPGSGPSSAPGSGYLLASGGGDATVRIWDAKLGTSLEELPHPGPVFGLAWHPDGGLLASGDYEGTLRLWQKQPTGPARCVQKLTGHSNLVRGLAFAAGGPSSAPGSGCLLASASWDGSVKLWELESGRCVQTLVEHTDQVQALACSPDGRTLASGGNDHTIWLWDVESRSSHVVLQGHSAVVYGLAFTPDSHYLLSGSEDGTLRQWDVASGQCVRVMQGYEVSLYDLAWHPVRGTGNPDGPSSSPYYLSPGQGGGSLLASAGSETVVSIWDVASARRYKELDGHRLTVYGLAWSPDGSLIASSGWDSAIRLWDPTTGTCVQILRDSDNPDIVFFGVAWSPDGQRLACGTYLHGVQVWDVTTRNRLWVDEAHGSWIRRVVWSPDGTRLGAGDEDGHVYLWDTSDGTLLLRLEGHHRGIKSVAWSLDGSRLASGGSGQGQGDKGELFVWDAYSGQRVHAFEGHPGVVTTLSWVPGGELLVSGGNDGRLRWWDLQSAGDLECVRVREAHQGTVHSLKMSPDGSILASCGDDGAIRLWDLQSGEPLQTLRRDRLYERLNITGIQGLTEAQKASLRALGAFEETSPGK